MRWFRCQVRWHHQGEERQLGNYESCEICSFYYTCTHIMKLVDIESEFPCEKFMARYKSISAYDVYKGPTPV